MTTVTCMVFFVHIGGEGRITLSASHSLVIDGVVRCLAALAHTTRVRILSTAKVCIQCYVREAPTFSELLECTRYSVVKASFKTEKRASGSSAMLSSATAVHHSAERCLAAVACGTQVRILPSLWLLPSARGVRQSPFCNAFGSARA